MMRLLLVMLTLLFSLSGPAMGKDCYFGLWSNAAESATQYPKIPDDWTPPEGWKETPAGEKTGGKHRQWVDEDGKMRRRWDREGREAGQERGPHWHDLDDASGGNDHIDPDD